MNYQASLNRLKKRKEELEKEGSVLVPSKFFAGEERVWTKEKKEKEWKLIESIFQGYSQSFSEEINSEKMEKAFSELEGFTEQKEDIRSLFLTKKYFKDQNIKFRESGKILCFVGPAGVGKTKFAKVIAKAMGRPFFKINVAGESDPQIIIGSDPSWVGSKYGRIIQSFIEAKSCDPVILIDEVEKMGESPIKGSPKDALLHVLDPEQNQEFRDKFLNIELDISRITFILTANSLDGLSEPLKNRLKIVKLKGYNEAEKLSIGKLEIENVFRETYGNAKRDLFEMNDDTLRFLIGKVKEEGVRQLKKEIENIVSHFFGQLALRHEKGEPENKIVIDENKVNQIVSDPKKKDKDEENENAESERRIRELEKEIQELRDKANHSEKNLGNNNSKSNSVGLPWAIGGGIALILAGCFGGWFLTADFAKKKKKKTSTKTEPIEPHFNLGWR